MFLVLRSDPGLSYHMFISHLRKEWGGSRWLNTVCALLLWLLLSSPTVPVLKPPEGWECPVS